MQNKGIKVLVTVIGDWKGIGLATMNPEQTTRFARIRAHPSSNGSNLSRMNYLTR